MSESCPASTKSDVQIEIVAQEYQYPRSMMLGGPFEKVFTV